MKLPEDYSSLSWPQQSASGRRQRRFEERRWQAFVLSGPSSRQSSRLLSTTRAAMGVHANLKINDGVGVVTFDSPGKVNVLNQPVMEEIVKIVDEIETNSDIQAAVLISGKPGCFIAGADITMIESCKTAEEAQALSKSCQDILFRIEKSKKPVVAAIMGSCLGGGLEVALSCHYRLAVKDKAGLGLPEVMLGVLPGGGGTQRLHKLVGVPGALDMSLTGKTVKADKAKKMGLVDGLVNPLGPGLQQPDLRTLAYLEEVAIKTAKDLASGDLKAKRGPRTSWKRQWERLCSMTSSRTRYSRRLVVRSLSRQMDSTQHP
ncbi:putative trifunctional enzyme subunit alpha, mitochondrial [Penaeus vannamei]|uniref:enoyl-CoA hydratase n=1 Tax=Penaeus vannamei TaxID=6689 RepID=A0A3R7Q4R4_PENVA|nr:putative trifunctional enzyme subunit alpha, mitochondrial [Penaeus vannamei]